MCPKAPPSCNTFSCIGTSFQAGSCLTPAKTSSAFSFGKKSSIASVEAKSFPLAPLPKRSLATSSMSVDKSSPFLPSGVVSKRPWKGDQNKPFCFAKYQISKSLLKPL